MYFSITLHVNKVHYYCFDLGMMLPTVCGGLHLIDSVDRMLLCYELSDNKQYGLPSYIQYS